MRLDEAHTLWQYVRWLFGTRLFCKGDYLPFDTTPTSKLSSFGQGGCIEWGALVMLLVLVPIVCISLIYGIGKTLSEQQSESAVMLLVENIFIPNSSEEYLPDPFAAREFNMPTWTGPRTASRRVINIVWPFHSLKHQFFMVHKPAHVMGFKRSLVVRKSVFNAEHKGGCFSVIGQCHSLGVSKVMRDRSIFSLVLLRLTQVLAHHPIRASAEKISAFGALGGLIESPHREAADNYQKISKDNESNVSEFSFLTKPNFQNVAIAIIGTIMAMFGAFLLTSDVFAFLGVLLIPSGIFFALYFPRHLLFWWAA